MVYCGKPSRGCQMCRTRRIKCDESKPTCLQCQKSRRQCPGYKDDFDLVFRNETQATERRARRSLNSRKLSMQVAAKQLSSPNGSVVVMSGTGDSMREILPGGSSILYQGRLSIPVEQQAMNYFMANWVLVPKPGQFNVKRGFLDYIIPLIKHEPSNSHLTAAFEAIALASLGNRPESKMLLGTAWQKYTKALSLVNRALANPMVQKSDQTLAAVMLLGHFETITLRRTNLAAWGTHIEGAVMLVKMRGKKQLRTKIGYALFVAVRQIMLINCMGASRSPELGVEWWISRETKNYTQRMVELNMRVTELRADVNRAMMLMPRTSQNTTKIQDLMRRAEALEVGFQEWLTIVPEEMSYKTVAWMDAVPGQDPGESDIFPGKVDMYTDLTFGSSWNMYRVARLFLSGIVIRCAAWMCSPVDYRTTPEYASASRLGVDMINDMVASIPFHLGWIGESGQFRTISPTGFACGEDGNGQAKVLGAYLLVWPLFTAICSDFTTDSQRKYITGRLNFMSDHLGLAQASVLSNFNLRLPSMIVKRDGTAEKMILSKMRHVTQSNTPSPSLQQIPGFPLNTATANRRPFEALHIYDRGAAINAGIAPNPRPDLSLNTSSQTLINHPYSTTTAGPSSMSTNTVQSRVTFSNPLPTHPSPHNQHASPVSYTSNKPSSYPTPASAASPPHMVVSPTAHAQNAIFQSQSPSPSHRHALIPKVEISFSAPPDDHDLSTVYDHSSPPPRAQAEEIDEADEGLKGEVQRHLAERLAFRRSFGAVISQVSGRDVADGMYRDRDRVDVRDSGERGQREFGMAGS